MRYEPFGPVCAEIFMSAGSFTFCIILDFFVSAAPFKQNFQRQPTFLHGCCFRAGDSRHERNPSTGRRVVGFQFHFWSPCYLQCFFALRARFVHVDAFLV